MFQRSNKTDVTKADAAPAARKTHPTIISGDVNVLGNIISDGIIDIDGNIEGNVRGHSVTIRKNGVVRGDVVADQVQVYGKVCGLVRAREVSLFASCHVEGVIMHESLTIEDGAFVDGQFKRTDKQGTAGLLEAKDEQDEYQVFRNLRLISA